MKSFRIAVILSLILGLGLGSADEAHEQQPLIPKNDLSEFTTAEEALGYDFDDEAFVNSYRCDEKHGYSATMKHRNPFMMVIDDFLTSEEADHFILAGLPGLNRSTVVHEQQGHVSEWRTSFTSYMQRSQDAVFECVQNRISALVRLPPGNIEPFQLVWYRTGQQYREHHDWFESSDPPGQRELKRGGQRVITMYLNTLNDDQGGHTGFPRLKKSVAAKKGRAAFWYNIGADGKEHQDNLHAGEPVLYGQKFGLNVWIRQGEFH